ncbi:hypothetical protein [Deinococcus daejeonensis]|uniref:Uncharacterized protein n=1 Tax=Deinococcus daejeonensis TaxID=1007098 RepID=A0ABQ2IRW6_9DEIO|nr:hypothetical protein [Deinococcus daejeonensis]GGN27319.1 hypothetical protein GCM10010842_00160 [Deinococcus daejeonensis]
MTPLQWAVLSAYARALTATHPHRAPLERATQAGAPSPAGQRVALELARQSGMIEGDRITEWGRTAARAYLPRLGIPAKGNA